MKYVLNLTTRIRKIGNKTVLWVDNAIYELNETGKLISELLYDEVTEEDIFNKLLEQYPTEKHLKEDIKEFVAFLISINAVKHKEI